MDIELFKRTGIMALGSRLRIFSDNVTNDASRIYSLYGVDVHPKWFPVLFALIDGDSMTVGALARCIGHSHPSVVKIVRELEKAGLAKQRSSQVDRRSTELSLTAKGRRLAPRLMEQCEDVEQALLELDASCTERLWQAIGEWEQKMGERSLLDRVMEKKVMRERDRVKVVNYDEACHHEAFVRLNEEWITSLFGVVEEADHRELDLPYESIVASGGQIFMALLDGEPVGTLALLRRHDHYNWELAKFAVSPVARGQGIGGRLLATCLRRIRMMGGGRLFLESNFKCRAAVHLYEKVGFHHLQVEHTDYARCDVQMEMTLE